MKTLTRVAKITRKGGEGAMKTTILMSLLVLALLVGNAQAILVGTDSGPIPISATVPSVTGGMDVSVSKVNVAYANAAACTGKTETWVPQATLSMPFGTLWFDTTNNVFRPGTSLNTGFYYAVDVGVVDNSGRNWQITVTPSTITNGSTTLNNKVNVVYQKVRQGATADIVTQIAKVAYGSSTRTIAKSELITATETNWLRVAYGLASGLTADRAECSADATGVLPLTLDTQQGVYSGSVRFTLAYL
jgi:hypothetical protein